MKVRKYFKKYPCGSMMQISFFEKGWEVSAEALSHTPYIKQMFQDESFFIGFEFSKGIEKLLKAKNFSEAKNPSEFLEALEKGDFEVIEEEDLENDLEEEDLEGAGYLVTIYDNEDYFGWKISYKPQESCKGNIIEAV